jgi:multiple sugar transport system substrate-binding protein
VQPALREAIGREDIWAVGLPMSVATTIDTDFELTQFQLAYQGSWLSRDRRVQVDDPAVWARMVRALDAYTDIWRKGCTPPDSVHWTNIDNNKAFLAQRVVMTANPTLSIPAALRTARPDDYYRNAATIDWPRAANGEALVIEGRVDRAVVFEDGGHGATAKQFARFLAEWGLAHWATSMGDQYMPPMRTLVEQPFWLDPQDPHRMRAAMQILAQPHAQTSNGVRGNEWRSGRIWEENVWGKAVHRVAADGISPSRRSTRRSPGSSRSSRSDGHVTAEACPVGRRLVPCAARRPSRRSRGVVAEGVLRPGGRGGGRDSGRLRARD